MMASRAVHEPSLARRSTKVQDQGQMMGVQWHLLCRAKRSSVNDKLE